MKKYKFAVLIDEPGREKLYLKRLISLLQEDYSFLREESRLTRSKSITKAKFGDYVVFGTHKKFDFTTVSGQEFDEDFDEIYEVSLQQNFGEVKKELKKYIRNSRDYVVDIDLSECGCVYEDDYDFYVVDTRKKPVVKKATKKRKAVTLEEVRVYHEYVQVGWDNFSIYLDAHGDEFIIVDGNVYFIERDSYGKGWLTA